MPVAFVATAPARLWLAHLGSSQPTIFEDHEEVNNPVMPGPIGPCSQDGRTTTGQPPIGDNSHLVKRGEFEGGEAPPHFDR